LRDAGGQLSGIQTFPVTVLDDPGSPPIAALFGEYRLSAGYESDSRHGCHFKDATLVVSQSGADIAGTVQGGEYTCTYQNPGPLPAIAVTGTVYADGRVQLKLDTSAGDWL